MSLKERGMIEMKYKGRKALFIAVAIYLLGVVVVTAGRLAFLQHENLNGFDRRLFVAAEALQGLLPMDFHDRALNRDSIGPEEDQRNLDNLSTHARIGGFAYLYTYVMDKGQIYFTSSSYTEEDVARNKVSRYWTSYPEGDQAYFDAVNSPEPVFVTASDRWGSFRTILIPRRSPAGNPYVIGVDIDISEIDKTLWKQIPWVVAAAFLLLLFAAPLAITMRQTLVSINNDLRVQLDENKEVMYELNKATEKANQAQQKVELYSKTLELRVAERTTELLKTNRLLQDEIKYRNQTEEKKEMLILDLQKTLKEVKTLRGLLPICASCKKIRDDKGYWNQIEGYIQEHSDVKFSHGICRECAKKYYPDFDLYED